MNINFLVPHLWISGGIKAIAYYANGLSRRGHKVTIICPEKDFISRIKSNLTGAKPKWINIEADIAYVSAFNKRHIPDGDIIIGSGWQTVDCVTDCSLSKGKKFYFAQHYESLFHGSPEEVDKIYRYPIKFIAISTWIKDILREKFNVYSELIVTPVDLEVFYPTRSGYNKDKRICMLHHDYEWKGVKEGLAVFEAAKKEFPELKLVMFGARKKKIDIDCEYYYNPAQEKIADMYNSCDIFLWPSWGEGLGMPPMEAMACKCALVTTDTGGGRDYAIDGITALVSPSKNPEALFNNLKRILMDEELVRTLAENGFNYIKKFKWEDAVVKMEQIFERSL